jgi:hypothetical protein
MTVRELTNRLDADADYRSLLDEPEVAALRAKSPEEELSENDYVSLYALFDRIGGNLRKELESLTGYEEQLELLEKEMEGST